MAMVAFGKQAPMMPKAPGIPIPGGMRATPPRVTRTGGVPALNGTGRVLPPTFTPATVHGPNGDTSVPNTGYQYQPPGPPMGHFTVPVGGASLHPMPSVPGSVPQQYPHPSPVPSHGPTFGSVAAIPMGGGYAPPSVPPTQMPAPHVSSMAPGPSNQMIQTFPGQYTSPSGIHMAPHPLVGNSAGFDAAMSNFDARSAARRLLADRNIRTYQSMGQPAGPTPAIGQMVADHQNQQMLNGLSPSDANRLRLGGGTPVAPPAPQSPPILNSSSRFAVPRGVNLNEQTGSTYFKNGSGTGIVGKGAIDALASKGIRPTDLDPRSPFGNQARDALRQVTQASESRLAAERSAAGGGISKARQYEQAQADQRILNRARITGATSAASLQAAIRDTSRREDLRERLLNGSRPSFVPANANRGGGMIAGIEAADAFAKTPLGQSMLEAHATGGLGGVNDYLVKANLSPQEKAGATNWLKQQALKNPAQWGPEASQHPIIRGYLGLSKSLGLPSAYRINQKTGKLENNPNAWGLMPPEYGRTQALLSQ